MNELFSPFRSATAAPSPHRARRRGAARPCIQMNAERKHQQRRVVPSLPPPRSLCSVASPRVALTRQFTTNAARRGFLVVYKSEVSRPLPACPCFIVEPRRPQCSEVATGRQQPLAAGVVFLPVLTPSIKASLWLHCLEFMPEHHSAFQWCPGEY